MSLILKQEPANTISTPPAGKSTLFITDTSTMAVKNPSGDVTYFPTVQGSNTQVFFNDNGSINGNASLVFNKTTGTMTVANLSVTGTLNAGDISVSSIANGTSNVDIIGTSGNVTTSVAGVANVLVITSTGANITGTLSASGNITAPNFIGNIDGSANSATTAGTVTTAAQPNITSVGTLSSLSSSGNIIGGNLNTAGNVNSSIMVNGGTGLYLEPGPSGYINFFTTGGDKATITDTGNIAASNLIANSTVFSTTANVSGNVNAGNVVTGGIVSATGNVTASFFIGNGSQLTGLNSAGVSNGNSNVNIATANGNVTIAAVGNTTMTITGTGANISGTLSATGNITGGNLIANNLTSTRVPYVGTSKQLTDTASLVWDNANQVLKPGAGGTEIGGDAGFGYLFTKNITASGNANIANIGTSGLITATGNITGGNIITGGIISATGNGTFGNISATNHTGTTVTVTGNVTGGNLATGGILNVTGVGVSSIAGNLNMNGNWLTNVGYAVANTDAASKLYVDTLVSTGISYHQPVYVATTTTLATATGGTTAYNSPNGAANGIGAYISTTGTYLNIDGFNVQSVGRRILVKDEANSAWNGIYTYANTTAIVRSTDADQYGPDSTEQFSINDYFFTQNGTTNEGVAFIVSAPSGVITFGTSNITFSTFSTSQVYDAGTGINISGTTISANASQTQITAVGTLTTLSVSGNANVGNIGAAAGVFTTVAGSLTTAAQPNITSLGTLTSLSVTGNINSANVTATHYGAATGLTGIPGANVTGTVPLATSSTTAGTVTTAAQGNITSVGTLTSLGVSGAVTASTLVSNVATGTAPFTVTSTTQVANLNVASAGLATFATTANAVAGANVSGTVSSATTAGTVTTAAQGNITSVGTLTSLSVSGQLTNANITTGANSTAGNLTGNWTLSAGSRLQATYADLAEKYVADATYTPGTVLIFGGDKEVTLANAFDSTRVAGVVTTNPAYVMNSACEGEHVVNIALQGRAPVKVTGPVYKGDLLVSGANGHATANNIARAGTIIGKSLENFNGDSGIIEVAVGRF